MLKHLSWSPRQLEQVLLVYYQLRQTSPFSVMLLQSQLPHGGFVADLLSGGWSGGAMVLGKLPVPGRPTIWMTVGQGWLAG